MGTLLNLWNRWRKRCWLRQIRKELPHRSICWLLYTYLKCVGKRFAENREKISQKVGDIMGGQVVKMEWLERFDAAVASGEAKGEAKGDSRRLIRQICRKLRKGKDVRQIADEVEEEESLVRSIYNIASGFAPDFDEQKVIEAFERSEAEEELKKTEVSDNAKVTA